MPCFHPITIVNPTKYVSLKYRDRFTLRVPCGQCAYCQEAKKREYYLRAYYHAEKCLSTGSTGSFVLFDTLTYSPAYLPIISDYFPTKYNYPCFDGQHIRKFIAKLRQRCKRNYNSNFDYMLSSEYGTDGRYTHRPHYHILFFVNGLITPLQFSALVADCWFYGRTDGKPYKSDYYVMNNVLNGDSAKKIRVLKYVTKYIAKSCLFTKQINKRINAIVFEMANMYGSKRDEWLNSLGAAKFREQLHRWMGQFHRQSTGFGAYLLENLDVNELFKDGRLKVVDNEKIILSIPVPTYYKRKLFYHQLEVDGTKIWSPTDLGVQYLQTQNTRLKKYLKDYYTAAAAQCKLAIDTTSLSEYVVDYRGRIKASNPESTIEQRLQDVDLYKYATRYDRQQFGKLGLTNFYLGNSTTGYYTSKMPAHIKLLSFGKRFSFYDDEKEKILAQIDIEYAKIDKGKQDAHETRQRLTNLYHYLQL